MFAMVSITTLEGGETTEDDIIISIAEMASAFYACRICKQNDDFICPRDLTPICANCKARYVESLAIKPLK
jgi:hypothetical protein